MFNNVYGFVTSQQQRSLPGLRTPLRLALLTDLHFGPYIREGSLDAWVSATNAAKPDVVVITGDFVDAYLQGPLAPLERSLGRLRSRLGTFGVWGNHDHTRFPQIGPLADAVRGAGVRILDNEFTLVRRDFALAGVDDWRQGRPDLDRALGELPEGAARVLLSHNPDQLPEVPAGAVDLALCGHTHGGQINLPLIGAPVTSSRYGQRFREGWVDAPVPAYVSRGLGVSLLPIRLRCPPELALFDLSP